jgi:GH24 family phage-related lysozyme (muramidase)
MEASDLLIKKITEFEGFSNTAYRCAAGGVATIG